MGADARDQFGMRGRAERERHRSPALGVPNRPLVEEVTGNHESPEELQRWRAKRLTHDRLDKIEPKLDAHGLAIAGMVGKLDTILSYATKSDEAAEKRRKYIVPTITAIGVAIAGIVAAMAHGCS